MTNVEDLIYRFRWQVAFLLLGATLAAGGLFLTYHKDAKPEFELIESSEQKSSTAIVEVSGAVNTPGVYKLEAKARVEEAINMAGGISSDANTEWVERYLNRAAFVEDGQKIYIPTAQNETPSGEVLSASSLININTASESQLEGLHGIGPVYAKKIIDNRPYSNVNELLVKKVISQKIYEDNRDLLTVY